MNNKGFSLVEVLASLVIISIVLVSFMALFTNTNRIAVNNSEKLVVVNLADSYLERVKINPSEFLPFPPTLNSSYLYNVKYPTVPLRLSNPSGVASEIFDLKRCGIVNVPDPSEKYIPECTYISHINNKNYFVSIKVSQSVEESNISLLNILVTVSSGKSKTFVEGYLPYVKSN